jgi:PiT family inorganic phosphate transporter
LAVDSSVALLLLVTIVLLALLFDYINGFHDAANAIAMVVSTKALSPRAAVAYGAALNFAGALAGTEVAATIGKGLVQEQAVSMPIILCALTGAILWNLLTWYKGLPTSSSHALIGSVLGAAFFSTGHGWESIEWANLLNKVVFPMFTSPIMGFVGGFALMAILSWIFYRVHLHKLNVGFSRMQLLSSGFLAYSHGHNDAQKSMGIIALALLIFSQESGLRLPDWLFHYENGGFHVPLWVIISCASMMALGTLSGGWKIIHTLGNKMIKLQPIYGFAAEATGATVIMAASHFGIPLSTTQVISSGIMGVGATKRLSAVKWSVVGNILWAWVLTIPLTFLFTGLLASIFRFFHWL